jgi:hypothetical protein
MTDGLISLSRVKEKERRNMFRNSRNGSFMLRSKLRRKNSAIPARLLAHGDQNL